MNGKKWGFKWFLLMALIVALLFYLAHLIFTGSEQVRTLFVGGIAGGGEIGEVAMDDPASLAQRALFFGKFSLYLYTGIIALQVIALAICLRVVKSIKKSAGNEETKLKMLENADIFFDLPLYVGLFGTVSAFLVLAFSPLGGGLIAYSSTLVGIIFSVFLRVVLLFPYREKLLSAKK